MTWLRALAGGALLVVALVLQVSLFPHVAWHGVVPNLCLLVVVGAGLTRGPQYAMTLGFVAGRAARPGPTRRPRRRPLGAGAGAGRATSPAGCGRTPAPPPAAVVGTVAACSFLGTSVFALSGLLIGDLDTGVPGLLEVIAVAVLWDVLLTPFVLPVVMRVFDRLEPATATA